MAEKKNKTKTCAHEVTYYSATAGDFVCQYCGKVIGELRMGKSNKKLPANILKKGNAKRKN